MRNHPIKKEVSCRVTRTLLLYVKEKNNGNLENLLDELPVDEGYLSDVNNWISHELLQVLYQRMIDLLEDPNAVYNMILTSKPQKVLGMLDRMVRLLGSPKLIYSQAPNYNKFIKLNGEVIVHDVGPSWAVIEDRYFDGTQKTRYDCDCARGVFANIPRVFGLPVAKIEEIKCQVTPEKYGRRTWPDAPPQGCEGCLFRVSWKPKKLKIFERLFARRNQLHQQAIEDLAQANALIQAKYDEVKQLAADSEKTNQALRESEEKYKSLVQYAPAGIYEFDMEKLRFISVNDVMCEYTGYSEKEFLELNPFDILSDESKETLNELVEEVYSNKVQELSTKYKIKGKNQREFWVLANARFFYYEDGAPKRAMAVVYDITDIRRAEEERKRLETQLQNAKKLELLGTLAAGVAHDLNNILSAFVSYPDLLLLDLDADSTLQGPLLAMKKSGEKAADIVQDLLTLARRGVSSPKVINLNRVVNDFLKSPEYDKILSTRDGIHINADLQEDLLNILGSEAHISKTLMNLVANAVEAMPAGGAVSIETRSTYLDTGHNGYESIPEGEYTTIQISDEGIGISISDLEQIFEPFYSKKMMGRSGTGLGMTVVWGTVKDHNGYIDIITEEGSGTTFALYFPASRAEMEAPSSVYIEDYIGKGESILIIDDSEEQRDLAKRMIQRLGYDAHTAANGEEAVSMIQKRHYDLLILDMIMPPGMDGLETYRKILEIVPDQKAVIASGYAETDRVREAQRLGAGSYVKKPFTLEQIGLAIRTQLEQIGLKID
ncbi:MAG: response regulator [Deltaproteobacteria bacterium]|nr:response regulator [Deltaproteobacteria bacterium]